MRPAATPTSSPSAARTARLRRRHVQRPRRERADRGRGRRLEAGCQDAAGPSSPAATATTVHNSTTVELSADVAKFLAPGDRVRISQSVDSVRLYRSRGGETARPPSSSWSGPWTATRPAASSGRPTAAAPGRSSSRGGRVRRPKTVREGRDVYAPEVAFVGPHLANADQLEIVDEASGQCAASGPIPGAARRLPRRRGRLAVRAAAHAGGRGRDGQARDGRYFSLFLNHPRLARETAVGLVELRGGSCFEWGVPAEAEERIQDALNMTAATSRGAPADHRARSDDDGARPGAHPSWTTWATSCPATWSSPCTTA